MKILVTGGAGFVGSRLVRYLLERNYRVVTYDKLDLRVVNPKAIAWMRTHPRCIFVEGNILDQPKLIGSMVGVDVVIHAAAQSAVDLSIRDPLPTMVTNAIGTVHVLEAMRRTGVKRLHYVSTDEVFGSAQESNFDERSITKPRNPYAAGKAAAEASVLSWANTYGLNVTITNSCNTYGKRQDPQKLIPRLTIRGILGKTLPVYGDGQQEREWIHVRDHCRAIWHVVEHGKIGQRYMVGGTKAVNMEMVLRILNILGLDESSIEFVSDRAGHDKRYILDSTKLRELGWAPEVPFEDGLYGTILWYRRNKEWWNYFLIQYDI